MHEARRQRATQSRGSEVPIAGNIVGFIVGTTGYIVTDLFVGESVEQGIRVGMGELGCDD